MTKLLKTMFMVAAAICAIAASSASAQMEVEVGGKVEAQVGFRGRESTAPVLIPSSVRPEFQKSTAVLDGIEKFERGVRSAIVTDSLIDIWATGTYDYECLGCTTYGAKIELFADPSANKYSIPTWEIVFDPTISNNNNLGFVPFPVNDFVAPLSLTVPNPGPTREVKIFVENCLGKFEIGDTIGATKHLQVDAATVAVGNGGIAGDARLWATPLNFLGMFGSADMITNKVAFHYLDSFFSPLITDFGPSLLIGSVFTGVGTQMRYCGKVSYYTPRFSGFAVGISYIPDTDNFGSVSQISNAHRRSSPFGMGFRSVIEGGINYDCKIQDVGIKAAILAESGRNKKDSVVDTEYFTTGIDGFIDLTTNTHNLKAYEFGCSVDYCGVAVAGSYGVNRPLIENHKSNRYWTIGAAYTYACFGISVNYMDNRQKTVGIHNLFNPDIGIRIPGPGQFDKVKYRNFVVDLEYKICDGLIPYVSYANLNVRQPFNLTLESKFNQGIGLVGLKVLF